MSVTVRKPFSHGLSFDFKLQLSHSIDRGGGAESGAGTYGALCWTPTVTPPIGLADFDAVPDKQMFFMIAIGKGKWLLICRACFGRVYRRLADSMISATLGTAVLYFLMAASIDNFSSAPCVSNFSYSYGNTE